MWLQRLICKGLKPVWTRYWTFHVEGRMDVVGPTQPVILASNHCSFLDPWLLSSFWPRPIHHLINRQWYERSRLWSWFFAAQGTIPVEPADPDATFAVLQRALERGAVVGIFPEGRISADGKIQRFRSGVVQVAARSGVPVLPLGLRGTFESIPRHRRFPRRGTISLHVGEPMTFPGAPVAERPPMREVRAFRIELYNEVCRLSGQEDRMQRLERGPRAVTT